MQDYIAEFFTGPLLIGWTVDKFGGDKRPALGSMAHKADGHSRLSLRMSGDGDGNQRECLSLACARAGGKRPGVSSYQEVDGAFYAVAKDDRDTLHEAGHVNVLGVVPGDDPDEAQSPHEGRQHVRHPIQRPKLDGLEVPLQSRQELQVVSRFLRMLQAPFRIR